MFFYFSLCAVSSDDDNNSQQESTPQTAKSTPQTTKRTPRTTKSSPQAAKSTPQTAKSIPQTTKSTPQTSKSTYFCKICKMYFPDQFDYECHMDAGYHKNKDGNYTCTFCKLPFATMATLTEHEKEHISMALSYSKTNTKTKSWEECFSSFVNRWEENAEKSSAKAVPRNAKKKSSSSSPDVTEVVDVPQESSSARPAKSKGKKQGSSSSAEVVAISSSASKNVGSPTSSGKKEEARKGQGENRGTSTKSAEQDLVKSKQELRTRKLSLSCQYCGVTYSMRANLLRHEREDHSNLSSTTSSSLINVKNDKHKSVTVDPKGGKSTSAEKSMTAGKGGADKGGKSVPSEKSRSTTASKGSKVTSPDKTHPSDVKYYCVFGCEPPMEHTYPNITSLWYHAMMDHKDTSNQCTVCKMKFSTWGKANRHLENKHKIQPVAETEPEPEAETEQEAAVVEDPIQEPEPEPDAESDTNHNLEVVMELDSEPELEIDLGETSEPEQDSNSDPDVAECETVAQSGKEEYLCVFGCTYSVFETLDKLAFHVSIKHMNYRSLCSHCNLVFSNCAVALKHVKETHLTQERSHKKGKKRQKTVRAQLAEKSAAKQVGTEEYFLCTFGCEMRLFGLLSNLRSHAKAQHSNDIICQLCEISFGNINEVINHIGRCHKVRKHIDPSVMTTSTQRYQLILPKPQQPALPVQQQLAVPIQQQPPAPIQQQPAVPIQQQVQQQPALSVQQQPALPVQQHQASGALLQMAQQASTQQLGTIKSVVPPTPSPPPPPQVLLLTPVPTPTPRQPEHSEDANKIYICTYGCKDKHFTSLPSLEAHAMNHHRKLNKCQMCGIQFGTWIGVFKHISLCHFYVRGSEPAPVLLPNNQGVPILLPQNTPVVTQTSNMTQKQSATVFKPIEKVFPKEVHSWQRPQPKRKQIIRSQYLQVVSMWWNSSSVPSVVRQRRFHRWKASEVMLKRCTVMRGSAMFVLSILVTTTRLSSISVCTTR